MGASNDQIYEALLEIKQDLGEVKAIASNAHEFASAVSRKADSIREELRAHSISEAVHGLEGERRGRGMVMAAVVSVLSSIGATLGIIKAFGRGEP